MEAGLKADCAPFLENALLMKPVEQTCLVEDIEGDIPDFVRGRYYLNGPTGFERPSFRYRHWLDGDGMVSCLRFEDDHLFFINRLVRTTKFVEETKAGGPVFRTFGTRFPHDRLRLGIGLESTANVSVYRYGNSLLAFGEQGLPWELDPATLETRGIFDFSGRCGKLTPFAAHPKFDPVTHEMFNFGVWFSSSPRLYLHRFTPDTPARDFSKAQPIEHPCSVHDFGLSAHFAVFYLSPYLLDTVRFIEGSSLMDSLEWRPDIGSRLLILSRESANLAASIQVGDRYCLHLINCFEDGAQLVVDLIEMDRPVYDQYLDMPDLFPDVPEGRPVRLRIDVERERLLSRQEVGYCRAPDFPSIDARLITRPYDDFWMLGISATGRQGRKFFDELIHARWSEPMSLDVYRAPPMHYLAGEPIFIGNPAADSDQGVIICQLLDGERQTSAFVLFDAFAVRRGPIATIRLPQPVPPGFHASFYRS